MALPDWPTRLMLLYWGRRGALSRFTFEAARAATAMTGLATTISVSRQNESFSRYLEFGEALFPVDTFDTGLGALNLWRIAALRRTLGARLEHDRTEAVIELMPHVWSPLVGGTIRKAGAFHTVVVHDAASHPGDASALARRWIERGARRTDLVLTLSQSVAGLLAAGGRVPRAKIRTLFHPDLEYTTGNAPQPPRVGEPWRLMFLGRILAYKGLPLFLDAVDLLRREGINVHVGVFGEGPLGANARRLKEAGADVVNRWLTEEEIAEALPRFHAVVLAHTEASQSGVAATALGAGLPVVATPVGGLVEQVSHGVTGVLAERVDAAALAGAIRRLLLDDALYRTVISNIARSKAERSPAKFVAACLRLVADAQRQNLD